jgi:hypothetical protein
MKLRFAIACIFAATIFVCLPATSRARETGTNSVTAGKDSAASSTNAPTAEPPLPVSVFELTTETRDPFFPLSLRQAVKHEATNTAPAFKASSFVLKGLSGAAGHRLAVINNRTFAVGEKWEVTTTSGKFPIICDEIREQSVLIHTDTQLEPIELTLKAAK